MSNTTFCSVCDVSVRNKGFSAHLKSILHKNNSAVVESDGIEKVYSAFRSRIASYRVRCDDGRDGESVYPPAEFLSRLRTRVRLLLSARMLAYSSIKVNFELYAEFFQHKNDSVSIKSFATENINLHQNYNFEETFLNIIHLICKKIENFEDRDSGWAYLRSLYLEVNINKYEPLRGSSFIDLPETIKNKRACINIKNSDNYCFLWCVVASLFPAKSNAHRTTSYPHFKSVLNIKNLSFPVGFSDIKYFEKKQSSHKY